jgi:hypothetical protein
MWAEKIIWDFFVKAKFSDHIPSEKTWLSMLIIKIDPSSHIELVMQNTITK